MAGAFGIPAAEARAIAADVGAAVARWRDAAARCGIKKGEMDRMASAFEHEDAKAARGRTAANVPATSGNKNAR